ncbi:squalene epoxidase-domain-containing protein [Apiosordaria backusii]|uniref:Squalene monooxygenase n=1 Tax=Apiosordaria backusii TaxID=314023 RepID=A0AA40BKH4_9PEZI|nr:squalene epoxidase-domain-containing protein [Apiosordaria backusii]
MATKTQSALELERERREQHHEADVVIVGAGVFGCAAAYALANQGRSVILLERWLHEPDRIVGELLQPGGVAALKKLGLGKCLEGIDAIPCYGYHVLYRGDDVAIPYPTVSQEGNIIVTKGEKKDKKGPEGRAFHHGRFIMQLRKACHEHPSISVFETEVTELIRGEHNSNEILGVKTRTTTDKEKNTRKEDAFFGALTIIADGYASKFRQPLLNKTPVVRSKFYALELIDCDFPPQYYGHVCIGDASVVLLYQIGTHETRALIDVPLDCPAASPQNGGVRGYIQNVVLPALPKSVQPSVVKALADGKIPKSMPNSWLPPTKQTTHPGVLVLGDAHNMRHPLTGGGMTVAFNDVVVLTDLLRPDRVPNLGDHAAVSSAMSTFHYRRKSLTSIINVLAQALYSLFAADDWQLRALQRGCFRYFQMGRTDEPVALMGGMMHRPMVLARHFFTVAFLAIWMNSVDVCGNNAFGVLMLPVAVVQAVMILWKACVVFLPVFGTELW